MIKALVFDFDGLILDTEYAEFATWEQVYEELSFKMRLEDWTSLIGRGASTTEWTPYNDLAVKLGDNYDENAIRMRRHVIFDELIKNETILPGVADLIHEAEVVGLKLAVASSSPRTWVEGFLTQLQLGQHFSVVKTADDVEFAKPRPDLYLAALDALSVTASEAFALEDSANGTTAAKAAGLFCVTVPNRLTKYTSLAHSDHLVDSLADVSLKSLCETAEQYYARLLR